MQLNTAKDTTGNNHINPEGEGFFYGQFVHHWFMITRKRLRTKEMDRIESLALRGLGVDSL